MNVNTRTKQIIYLLVLLWLTYMLIREYLYIHPYNPGMGLLGPKWTYISTKTFTWWFLLVSSLFMISPVINKQKIGIIGLLFLLLVLARPLVQNKFPEETVLEFYQDRKENLNAEVKKYGNRNKSISNDRLQDMGFEKLVIQDDVFFFLCIDEDFPFGVCYTKSSRLPAEVFDNSEMKYLELEEHWYEFDY